jgi:hypothetical protein
MNGKGDKRRPMYITNKQLDNNWSILFDKKDELKVRHVTPAHAVTRVEEDKSKKIPRKDKYKHINISGE